MKSQGPCCVDEDWITRAGVVSVLNALKRFLVGQPLRTSQAVHERLTKRVALAVFASDALSSVTYASEEILLVLR
jgi:hypothetical protein